MFYGAGQRGVKLCNDEQGISRSIRNAMPDWLAESVFLNENDRGGCVSGVEKVTDKLLMATR